MATKNTLLIIDAYGFVFRAFHVLPSMTSPDGIQVAAIYGFTSMLLKLLNNFKPNYVLVVFDAGGKNFRHGIYSEYKSHRPLVPQELLDQLILMREVASSLNLPVIEQGGYEADDVIATIATKAYSAGDDVVIISSDKDLMQLINDNIQMYDPMKDKYITRENVIEKFGVEPEKLREVMALIGDSSDNIPGIRGIGPKTASSLIMQFGSINVLLRSLDSISNIRHRNMISESKDILLISWQLVGLDCQIDLDYDLDSFRFLPPAPNAISKFLTKYGFKSLYKRVEDLFQISIVDNSSAHKFTEEKIAIQALETREEIVQFIKLIQRQGIVSVYIIRYLEKRYYVFAIDKSCFVIHTIVTEGKNISSFGLIDTPDLMAILRDKSIKKITWNLKHLIQELGLTIESVEDIELMQYAIGSGKSRNESVIAIQDFHEHITANPVDALNSIDYLNSLKMVGSFQKCYDNVQAELIRSRSMHLYKEIDLPLSYVLNKMEQAGVKLNSDYLRQLSIEFDTEIKKLELEIFALVGSEFNIGSPKQLGSILFEKMQLPFGKVSSKTKTYSTNAEILEKLSYNGFLIGDLLIKWRMLSKLKNTYTDTLPREVNKITGRVHTSFLQTSTSTGRLSSQNPNLQNVPIRSVEGNKIRAAFIAEPGYKLISADYSQIELRILSDMANVSKLKEAFACGTDIHSQTACQIFKIDKDQVTSEYRRKAKAINFGIIYGISSFGLAKQLNITTNQAAEYIKKYFEEYPDILEYMENIKAYAREHGYVSNFFGRKCYMNTINDKNHTTRQFAERAAINAPLQSTSSDIIKIAMINLDRKITELKLQTKLLLQIHDELLFESPIDEVPVILPIINKVMQNSSPLSVPMVVDAKVGDNWMEIH
jgi:DNA polymerase-1